MAGDEIVELLNENEQLKQFKNNNIKEYLELKKVCNDCKQENKKLKEKISELEYLLELDKHVKEAMLKLRKEVVE